jgi:FSR family fosmidomycin resistance protein-like MFS transporter
MPVLSVAVGHGIVDTYAAFLAPLLPIFAHRLDLSLALVGSLASIINMADGLSQPLFGYWGDRMRRPWMTLLAPACVGLATACWGLATGYGMLACLLVLSGTARSAFHPQGAAAVTQYAGPRRGLAMSLFTAAGNLGFALGPLLATALIAVWDLPGGTLVSLPLGVLATLWIYGAVFRDQQFRAPTWRPPALRAVLEQLLRNRGPFLRLWFLVILRSLAYFAFFTFLPIIFTRQGLSPLATGAMVSLFLLGGAMGGIAGGWLSDRLEARAVIVGSLALAFPTLELALVAPGFWGTVLLMLGGFWLLASAPVSVSLAQRLAPGAVATASSLILGLAWGLGGLLVTPIGALADHVGPIQALRIQTLCLLVAVLLGLGLPSGRRSPSTPA